MRATLSDCKPNVRRLIMFYQQRMIENKDEIAREVYKQLIRRLQKELRDGDAA